VLKGLFLGLIIATMEVPSKIIGNREIPITEVSPPEVIEDCKGCREFALTDRQSG
jgi:hypothetical protein